jgi:hypothetical protein
VAELENGRLVRHGLVEQIEPGKAAHARDVVEGVFHARIGQVEPLLHEVDAQHRFQPTRPAPLARLGIVRLDQRHQRRPRRHRFHFCEESLAPRPPLLPALRQRGKGNLLHRTIRPVSILIQRLPGDLVDMHLGYSELP